jgi:aromatic ring-opening dioxygenase catalytic subunit (LigB family)
MAELVGVYAASHGPMIAREWDRFPQPLRERIAVGFDAIGERFKAARPDVLVILSPDHWVNFFLNNYPAFCIGVGEEHDGPPEPFLKPHFNHPVLKGHPALGRHILNTAIEQGGDPALSHRMTLDHGFCLPLWRMGLESLPPIVPIVVNEIESPMPTLRRCIQWGHMLRQAIDTYPEPLRVAILASGGLSHYIGQPHMGEIDEAFDRTCISLLQNGDEKLLADTLQEALPKTGNGGEEVRSWVIAHAAAGSSGFELLGYEPLKEIYVGCAWGHWRV